MIPTPQTSPSGLLRPHGGLVHTPGGQQGPCFVPPLSQRGAWGRPGHGACTVPQVEEERRKKREEATRKRQEQEVMQASGGRAGAATLWPLLSVPLLTRGALPGPSHTPRSPPGGRRLWARETSLGTALWRCGRLHAVAAIPLPHRRAPLPCGAVRCPPRPRGSTELGAGLGAGWGPGMSPCGPEAVTVCLSQAAKLARMKVPPREMFLSESDKYSRFDENVRIPLFFPELLHLLHWMAGIVILGSRFSFGCSWEGGRVLGRPGLC